MAWTKEKTKEYNKKYRQANKEKLKKQDHERYLAKREKILKRVHKYEQDNKEKISKQKHEYYLKDREKKIKEAKRWQKEHPEKTREKNRKHYSKRRGLGFNPLNEPFKGCVVHHINFNDVIYIPKEIHQSISHCLKTGRNMALINSIAYQFLFGNYIIYK